MEDKEINEQKTEVAESKDNWWGSWINAAKEKTSTVFEAVRKDLDELSTVVRHEATSVGAAISSSFDQDTSTVGTVKKSLSSFFGQVTEALIPSLEEDEVEAVLITHNGTVTLTGFPLHLAELQSHEKTYLSTPDVELIEQFNRWRDVVDNEQFTQDRLARHLASSEILNEMYLKLVPEKVSHMSFWQRYLFKRALLEDAIANAEIAEARAKSEINTEKSSTMQSKNAVQTEQPKLTLNEPEKIDETDFADIEKQILNKDIDWENETIATTKLTEEEQIRLLEQYEQEIQERDGLKKKKSNENIKAKNTETTSQDAKKLQKKSTDKTSQEMKKKIIGKSQQSISDKQNKLAQKQQNAHQSATTRIAKKKDKDESSSTSDESWEKDFDLNE